MENVNVLGGKEGQHDPCVRTIVKKIADELKKINMASVHGWNVKKWNVNVSGQLRMAPVPGWN